MGDSNRDAWLADVEELLSDNDQRASEAERVLGGSAHLRALRAENADRAESRAQRRKHTQTAGEHEEPSTKQASTKSASVRWSVTPPSVTGRDPR